MEPLQSDLTSDQHARIFCNADKLLELATGVQQQVRARLAESAVRAPLPSSPLLVTASMGCAHAQSEGAVRHIGDLLKDAARSMQRPFTVYCANKCVLLACLDCV